jgi:hypothetical protein
MTERHRTPDAPAAFDDGPEQHHLRILIEQLVKEGRSEHEIEALVLEATGRETRFERPSA